MSESKPVKSGALLEEAKSSEHGESYRLMSRDRGHRIGVGARAPLSGAPYFFIEGPS